MLLDYLQAVLSLFDGTIRAMMANPFFGLLLVAMLLLMTFYFFADLASSLQGGYRHAR